MGILDFLSPALTTATGAASAAQGAQAGVANKQREERLQQAMLQAKLLKEKHDQEIMDALRRAQTKHFGAQTAKLEGGDDEALQYVQNDAGEYVALPKKMPRAASVSVAQPPTPVAPQGAPMAAPPQQAVAPQQPPLRGTPTGVKGKMPPDPTKVHATNRDYDVKHPLPQIPTNVYLPIVDASGKTVYGVGQSKGDPSIKPTDTQKPMPAASATNVGRSASVRSGIAQMVNAHEAMRPFEQALRNGTANISGLDQFVKQTGTAFSHSNPMSNAAMAVSLAWLSHQNPELARYVRRGLEYAQGESQVTNRPSDFRVKLSDFLASAQTGNYLAHPEVLADIDNTREATLAPLREYLNVPGAGGGRGGGGAPAGGPPSFEDWVKAKKP